MHGQAKQWNEHLANQKKSASTECCLKSITWLAKEWKKFFSQLIRKEKKLCNDVINLLAWCSIKHKHTIHVEPSRVFFFFFSIRKHIAQCKTEKKNLGRRSWEQKNIIKLNHFYRNIFNSFFFLFRIIVISLVRVFIAHVFLDAFFFAFGTLRDANFQCACKMQHMVACLFFIICLLLFCFCCFQQFLFWRFNVCCAVKYSISVAVYCIYLHN